MRPSRKRPQPANIRRHFDGTERAKYIDHVSSEFIHRRHESADIVVCHFSSVREGETQVVEVSP
jgi:hypothetical protein